MTEVNPPAWEQAGTYSAQQDRMTLMALALPDVYGGTVYAPSGGVRPSAGKNGLAVHAESSPDMSVTVNGGTCFVPATIDQNAGWVCVNTGAARVPLAAAPPGNARFDAVIAHVYDASDDSGPGSQWALEAVTGIPASTPTLPALPSNCLLLAYVTVPAAVPGITEGEILDRRTYQVAAGGILPSTANGLPAQPYPGLAAWCEDTGEVVVYQGPDSPNANTWQSVAGGPGPWITHQGATPSIWTPDGNWHAVSNTAWPAASLTVPRSGGIFVSITIGIGNSGSSVSSVGFQVTGAGGSPVYTGFAGHNALTVQGVTALRATSRVPVTGLTPGASIVVQPGSNAASSSSPADDNNGVLCVEPML